MKVFCHRAQYPSEGHMSVLYIRWPLGKLVVHTTRFFKPKRMVVVDCSKIVNTCNYRTYDTGRTRDEVRNSAHRARLLRALLRG